jgi:hypothetical protein
VRQLQPVGEDVFATAPVRWDEGRRHAFHAESANLPMSKHLAEDHRVAPDGPGACRLTWRAALEPPAIGRLGGPVDGLLFRTDTGRHCGAR